MEGTLRAERIEAALRIVVLAPVAGVASALQSGQAGEAGLVPPVRATPQALVFDFAVIVDGTRPGGRPRLLGPFVQGPPDGRFVYINWGVYAGDPAGVWNGRTKVPLTGLDWALIEAIPAGGRLEARIDGQGRKGGPAFATVPLAPPGWRVLSAAEAALEQDGLSR
jgi:hypothetical protein